MANIGDRIDTVASLLGGRSDIAGKISQWILAGYRDIAHTIPFDTLEETANTLCAPNITSVDYPSDARAIKSLTLGIPAANPTSQRPVFKRNIAIIDRYNSSVPGVPAIWAPYKKQVFLRPVPNDAYPLTIRYWQKVQVDPTDINSTELLVEDDWLEIIDYASQIRGFMDLQEFDKAGQIRALLYGNPLKPGMPGLIKQRLTRIQAESENANYGLRPRLSRYTHVK